MSSRSRCSAARRARCKGTQRDGWHARREDEADPAFRPRSVDRTPAYAPLFLHRDLWTGQTGQIISGVMAIGTLAAPRHRHLSVVASVGSVRAEIARTAVADSLKQARPLHDWVGVWTLIVLSALVASGLALVRPASGRAGVERRRRTGARGAAARLRVRRARDVRCCNRARIDARCRAAGVESCIRSTIRSSAAGSSCSHPGARKGGAANRTCLVGPR